MHTQAKYAARKMRRDTLTGSLSSSRRPHARHRPWYGCTGLHERAHAKTHAQRERELRYAQPLFHDHIQSGTGRCR
eukprot:3425984-Pleurochrysis_carterae.AAC.1